MICVKYTIGIPHFGTWGVTRPRLLLRVGVRQCFVVVCTVHLSTFSIPTCGELCVHTLFPFKGLLTMESTAY